MVVFPAATPDTIPVLIPTVATERVLLLQAPPDTLSLRLMVDPTHTELAPLIVPGSGAPFTVTVADAVVEPQILVTV